MIKYSSDFINSLSLIEWNNLIVQELNNAGFGKYEYDKQKRCNQHLLYSESQRIVPKNINDEFIKLPKEAIDYLKSIGLLNNGRCPYCGNVIDGYPIDNQNPTKNATFHICSNCAKRLAKNKAIGIVLITFACFFIISIIIRIIGSLLGLFNYYYNNGSISILLIYALIHGGNKLIKDRINRELSLWKKLIVYSAEIFILKSATIIQYTIKGRFMSR